MIAFPENACDLLSLAAALRSGAFPLPDYLSRLEALFDAREPEVQAFLPEPDRFGRLRQEAEQLAARYPDPGQRPALFGVPVAVKDVFHVSDFATRAGSTLPPELLVGSEGPVVTALKRAGALILGKTVTTEFAYLAPGPTRNPHNPRHTPGGSSSGSAAAVAAGLTPFALGTQTVGSTNRPASYCGIAGFKPSYDRLDRRGIVPLAPSLDHVGLLAADVAAIEAVFGILATTRPKSPAPPVLTLGIPEGPYLRHTEAAMRVHFHNTCDLLSHHGCVIVTVPVMEDFERFYELHHGLVAAEAARVHRVWYRDYQAAYRSETAELIERGRRISARTIQEARAARLELRQLLVAAMDRHRLDLWLTPGATGVAPKGLHSTGDSVMQLPWTLAGLPLLTVPSGFLDDLPVGIQLAGAWYADQRVLELGALIERCITAGR